MVETVYSIPNAPEIALISDLHNRPAEKTIRSLCAHRPDLICIAGDVFYGSWPKDDVSPLVSQINVIPFLEACAGMAPTYLSFGNHEWMLTDEDIGAIKKTGITVLDNSWAETGIKDVIIGGLTSAVTSGYRRIRAAMEAEGELDSRYPSRSFMDEKVCRKAGMGRREKSLPDTDWLKDFCGKPGYHVLLSHHPEYFDQIDPRVELVLSGHSHGGQWNYWSPVTKKWKGVFAPGQGFFPKFTSGIYEKKYISAGGFASSGGNMDVRMMDESPTAADSMDESRTAFSRMVVGRGLANTAPVPRFFNPTEIVFIKPE